MKTLIFSLLMATTITGMAQNGGQFPENGSVKIQYAGGRNFNIYNKQSCSSQIEVKVNNNAVDTLLTVPGNSFVIYTLPAVISPNNVDLKAKTTTNCGGTDFGYVELFVASLPVTFTSFNAALISGNQYQITFEVGNPSHVKSYNVQQSTDGITWKTITVILPDDRSKYSIKLNLQK